jgi:hypothetical protein
MAGKRITWFAKGIAIVLSLKVRTTIACLAAERRNVYSRLAWTNSKLWGSAMCFR